MYWWCRPLPGVLTRSPTMARPGTTLLPSICSCSTPLKPSQRSVRQSNTIVTAGRPGPTMGRLLPRLAMACLLPELCRRQAPAIQFPCLRPSHIPATACCYTCAKDWHLLCNGLLLPIKFAVALPAAAPGQGLSSCLLIALALPF